VKLQDDDFSIEYRAGSKMGHVDYLLGLRDCGELTTTFFKIKSIFNVHTCIFGDSNIIYTSSSERLGDFKLYYIDTTLQNVLEYIN
jgi:hypothetical protein